YIRQKPRNYRQKPRDPCFYTCIACCLGQKPRYYRQKPRYNRQKPRYNRQKPRYNRQKPRCYRQKPRQKPRYYRQKPRYNRQKPRCYRQKPRQTGFTAMRQRMETTDKVEIFKYGTAGLLIGDLGPHSPL
uniref:Uncharacterized protein n=1 Tax=Oncorhynchus mykiss TaxID=8022 RepID=A0A8L0DPF5_ONCMY